MSTDSAVARGRYAARARMKDTVVVRRPGTDTDDPDSITDAADFLPDPVYSGICRVKDGALQARTVGGADSTITVQVKELHIPDDAPALLPGDVAFMADDTFTARLRGMRLRVTQDHAGTDTTAQRVPVETMPGVSS